MVRICVVVVVVVFLERWKKEFGAKFIVRLRGNASVVSPAESLDRPPSHLVSSCLSLPP